MSNEQNPMKTINIRDVFPTEILNKAEEVRLDAQEALQTLKSEYESARAENSKQYDMLSGRIPELRATLRPLEDCIQMKTRAGLDHSDDKTKLAHTHRQISEMEAEMKTRGLKFREMEEQHEKSSIVAMDTLRKAEVAAQAARTKVEKASRAHEAHQANPLYGIGPIPSYRSFKDVLRAHFKIGFSLSYNGEAATAHLDLGQPLKLRLKNGGVKGGLPDSLSWLGRFEEYRTLANYPHLAHISGSKLVPQKEFEQQFPEDPHKRRHMTQEINLRCYIEDSGAVLASRHKLSAATLENNNESRPITVDFSDMFSSFEDMLKVHIQELAALERIDLQSDEELPVIAALITEAWKESDAAISTDPKFKHNQARLSETAIAKLIGAYWNAFISSPWEPSIKGSYSLLKHRCMRGETPNVFSYETPGHFGFRVRTPDHDWIDGEIFCPTENFSPQNEPDPSELRNETWDGDWYAQLGPVKFIVRGTTSKF